MGHWNRTGRKGSRSQAGIGQKSISGRARAKVLSLGACLECLKTNEDAALLTSD